MVLSKGIKMNKKRRMWGAAIIGMLCVGSGIYAWIDSRASLKAGKTEKTVAYKGLNDVITNEMSASGDLERMDYDIDMFMRKWEIRGLSLAVVRHDSLLYAKSYGYFDADRQVPLKPGHIMRIASVSKLITGAAVMKLVEQGKIRLDSPVFGPRGILNDKEYTDAIKDTAYYSITVEDLLRHEGGFTNAGGDPMFNTPTMMLRFKLEEAPDSKTLVKNIITRRLRYRPGSMRYYSNFGYMLLSLVVEKASGQDYETYAIENLLRPAGCYGFHIAGTYKEERRPEESYYYMASDAEPVPEYNNSGRMVPRCYGGNNIRGLQGAGGWAASAVELARLVASIDGDPRVKDVLSAQSVKTMTGVRGKDSFGIGWHRVSERGEWVRSGSLSCTGALIQHFGDGECWVLVTNTGSWIGPRLPRQIAAMFNRFRQRYSAKLPRQDLFLKMPDNNQH